MHWNSNSYLPNALWSMLLVAGYMVNGKTVESIGMVYCMPCPLWSKSHECCCNTETLDVGKEIQPFQASWKMIVDRIQRPHPTDMVHVVPQPPREKQSDTRLNEEESQQMEMQQHTVPYRTVSSTGGRLFMRSLYHRKCIYPLKLPNN